MKIIINADDLGYSETVNAAVFDLMSKELISSATLIANGPSINSAIASVKQFPRCSFGVHLNLTEFKPFTNIQLWKKYQLADSDGIFCCAIRQIKPNAEIKKAVGEEFFAQIEYLNSQGVTISHIDSHQHIHTIPWIFFILKAVQKKYRIVKVRIALNLYLKNNTYLLLKKYVWNLALQCIGVTKTTEYFIPFLWFVNNVHGKLNNNSIVELMVHPDSANQNEELKMLYSDWTKRIGYSLKLISYNDL